MNLILKWVSWLACGAATYLLFMGCLGYLLGNIQLLHVKYTTYILFSGYFLLFAIMVLVLRIACRKD